MIVEKEKCYGCNACMNICPKQAIKMEKDEKGFLYPIVDKEKCINCDLCKKVCPSLNCEEQNKRVPSTGFACINKDESIRIKSSSGGIFTLIAQEILKENGVVFGARFDKNFKVVHDYIEKKEELDIFRGSKYVQSEIKDTYKQVKNFLEQGKKVLFTGTPCQIEGLYNYLMKEYENLYTQDFICHGVPSPEFWRKYLQHITKNQNNIENINFREKIKYGWNDFSLLIRYNNKEYNKTNSKDFYMQMFLLDVVLRDSCYSCKFKNFQTKADITLGDLWGAKGIIPKMHDNKGLSIVFVNSKKGKEIFNKIMPYMKVEEITLEKVGKYNKGLLETAKKPKIREEFFMDLENKSFNKVVKKYKKRFVGSKRFIRKCKNKLKKIVKVK